MLQLQFRDVAAIDDRRRSRAHSSRKLADELCRAPGGSGTGTTTNHRRHHAQKIKEWLLLNRLAAIGIAIEHTEQQRQHIEDKLEMLSQREIDLRIRYAHTAASQHIRHTIYMPGAH